MLMALPLVIILPISYFAFKSQEYLSPLYAPGEKCWGMQSQASWTNYPRFMFDHHAIQDANGNPITKAPDYNAAFTNQFLPAC